MTSEASVRGAVARAIRTARRHWRPLLVIGAAIFVPLGLLETLDEHLGELEVDELGDAQAVGVLGFGLATVFTALLGEIFFSGVVAAAVQETHGGRAPSLGELVRSLPYVTLIAIDLLFAVGLAVGLLLLIGPGIVFFGWFALAAPVAKIEHLGVRAGFRRSRELARGNLGLILLVLLPVAIGGQLLAGALGGGLEAVVGEAFGFEWLGATLAESVATPVWAFAAVALTYELIDAEVKPGGTRSDQPVSVSS